MKFPKHVRKMRPECTFYFHAWTPQGYTMFGLYLGSAGVLWVGFTEFICGDKRLHGLPSPGKPGTAMSQRTLCGERGVEMPRQRQVELSQEQGQGERKRRLRTTPRLLWQLEVSPQCQLGLERGEQDSSRMTSIWVLTRTQGESAISPPPEGQL